MDECWIYLYDPETKEMSKQWKHTTSPPPRKAKVQKSAGKVMLSVFWDCRGVILTDYLAKGETINSAYYCTLLNKLRDALKKKRRGMLTKGIRLLADNAPAHSSQASVMEARQCGYEILPHPPYSPDLAPSDFFLFPQMKTPLRGRRFDDTDEVIQEVEQEVFNAS
jgi:histone-lysine N-methyltransferase SETMAR